MEEGDKTSSECPVCGKSFPCSFINTHVNECLSVCSTDTKMTDTKKRKSSDSTSVKGWGFLNGNVPKKAKVVVSKTNTGSVKSNNIDKNSSNDSDDECIIFDEDHEEQLKSCNDKSEKLKKQSNNNFQKANPKQESSKMQVPEKTYAKSVSSRKQASAPLAERMRPKTLDDYVGQNQAVGPKSLLYSLLRSEHIPSMILWGPPGCGKTTLAKIIANNCKARTNIKFVTLSAAMAGISDVKQTVNIAKNDQKMFQKKTILFLDEIHRFNKTQQDSLLPHVEDGTITLIGATTENPSFQVNSALLSRSRVIVLEKLSTDDMTCILTRALEELGGRVVDSLDDIDEDDLETDEEGRLPVLMEQQAMATLASLCDGDARSALNGLQMAVESRRMAARFSESENKVVEVTTDHIKDGLQRSHVLYDRAGEEHYNIISAMHKSIRGSDASAALYWLARMLEGGENPLYVARRLVRLASEDIGLADPLALNQAVAAYQACHFLGMPECDVILAQCVVYMARAAKSVEVYKAYANAKKCVREHDGPLPSVPLHLRNASTKLMKNLGYGAGYKYNPDYDGPVDQEYFPDGLRRTDFFT